MRLLDPHASRPAIAGEDIVYNVAYGSNMDEQKLRSRTPEGRKPIEFLSKQPVTVPGYGLRFRLAAVPPTEPVMADVLQDSCATLHGVLYKLSRYDYDSLCLSEHCAVKAPSYREDVVEAFPYDGKPPIQATLFVSYNAERIMESAGEISGIAHSHTNYLHPSERYLGIIRSGARTANLNPEYIIWLDKIQAARPVSSFLNRKLAELALVGIFSVMSNDRIWRVLWFLKNRFLPLTVNLYVRREQAAAQKRPNFEAFWNVLMMGMYMPFVLIGIVSLIRRTTRVIFRE